MQILLCGTILVALFAGVTWWRITSRGPKLRLNIRHAPAGVRAWTDEVELPHPRYDIWIKAMIFVLLSCVLVAFFVGWQIRGMSASEVELPTYVMLDFTGTPRETETSTPEQSETPTPTGFMAFTPAGDLIILETYTPYPTYTLYPTFTAMPTIDFDSMVQIVEVERVVIVTAEGQSVVYGSAVVREQRQPQQQVIQPPPQQYYQPPPPPVFNIPANYPTPTPWIFATVTPAISNTPAPTSTIGVCATGVPQMFMTPTPSFEWWLPCNSPTPPPTATPTETQTLTATIQTSTATASPTDTATYTETPNETAMPEEIETYETDT